MGVGIAILAVNTLGRSDMLSQRHEGDNCYEEGSVVADSGPVRIKPSSMFVMSGLDAAVLLDLSVNNA